MSVAKRMLAGSVWSALGNIASRAAGLISTILVARMLGAHAFGEFSLVRSTVMTILTFGSAGIGVTATRYIARHRFQGADAISVIVGDLNKAAFFAGLATAALLFLLAPFVATEVLATPSLENYLRTASIVVFLSALNSFQIGVLAGFESFRSIATVNAMNGVLIIALVALGAWLAGISGAIAGMAVAAVGTVIVGWRLCRICYQQAVPARSDEYGSNPVSTREMIGFAIPVILSGLLVTPVLWICNATLVRSADGMHQVALFEAANQWRMLILFVPTLIAQVSLPVLSSLTQAGDFRRTLWANIGITLLLSLFAAGVLIPFSGFVMGFYGQEFRGGGTVLRWLAISAVMMAVNNVIGQAVSSLGKAWHGFMLNIAWAISIVLLTMKFIAEGQGAVGAAIAQCCAFALHSVIQIIYVQVISARHRTMTESTANA